MGVSFGGIFVHIPSVLNLFAKFHLKMPLTLAAL